MGRSDQARAALLRAALRVPAPGEEIARRTASLVGATADVALGEPLLAERALDAGVAWVFADRRGGDGRVYVSTGCSASRVLAELVLGAAATPALFAPDPADDDAGPLRRGVLAYVAAALAGGWPECPVEVRSVVRLDATPIEGRRVVVPVTLTLSGHPLTLHLHIPTEDLVEWPLAARPVRWSTLASAELTLVVARGDAPLDALRALRAGDLVVPERVYGSACEAWPRVHWHAAAEDLAVATRAPDGGWRAAAMHLDRDEPAPGVTPADGAPGGTGAHTQQAAPSVGYAIIAGRDEVNLTTLGQLAADPAIAATPLFERAAEATAHGGLEAMPVELAVQGRPVCRGVLVDHEGDVAMLVRE